MHEPPRSAGTGGRRAPDRALLEAAHRFPGPYVIKAFGPGTDAFRRGVWACATAVVGDGRAARSERATRSGHKICVTLTLQAQDVDEVLAVYHRLHDVEGLALIL